MKFDYLKNLIKDSSTRFTLLSFGMWAIGLSTFNDLYANLFKVGCPEVVISVNVAILAIPIAALVKMWNEKKDKEKDDRPI